MSNPSNQNDSWPIVNVHRLADVSSELYGWRPYFVVKVGPGPCKGSPWAVARFDKKRNVFVISTCWFRTRRLAVKEFYSDRPSSSLQYFSAMDPIPASRTLQY